MSGREVVSSTQTTSTVDWPYFKYASVSCPGGKRALGGGAQIETPAGLIYTSAKIAITGSQLVEYGDTSGWQASAVEMEQPVGLPWQLTVKAICATVN